MSLINTELLLEPASAANVAGDNLEYQPEFAALELAAEGTRERQMGSSVVAGEPANHARVLELAAELLRRSKDLRIAVRLERALLELDGFAGLAAGLGLIRGLLERYWESLYPELDPDDRDATMRIAALAALIAPEHLSRVRTAPLFSSARFGPITLRDVAVVAGEAAQSAKQSELDSEGLAASLRDAELGVLKSLLAAVQSARADLRAIQSAIESHAPMAALDFSTLDRALYQAQQFVRPHVDDREARAVRDPERAARDPAPDSDAPSSAEADARGRVPDIGEPVSALRGSVRGRDDVIVLLDRICEYYVQNEPSSPLPLLLRRCQRLASLSFIDILKDMAPDALSQVQTIVGKPED